MNAANEVAVEAFLGGRIGFLDIARAIEATLSDGRVAVSNAGTIEGVLAVDGEARKIAADICCHMAA
jgi:1-deoxy-D-xylulose-5-phosphate reductoisomerase